MRLCNNKNVSFLLLVNLLLYYHWHAKKYMDLKSKGDMYQMKLSEKTLSSELLYEGKIINLYRDTVELENHTNAMREVVHHPGGVSIVALTEDEQVYMVRQFRYPYHKVILEIPAGKLSPGEDPLECGKRELEEETGMTAKQYENLGDFYPSVGYVDEVIYCYLATGLTSTQQHLDEDEFLDVELIPLKTLYQMILSGEIQDGKTQSAILKVYCKRYGNSRID